tara:strand:+ start:6406 stop:7359 length:954 start_codon:yes stop_codon:yes gene_type:complete
MDTPVLLLFFNRSESTKKLIEALRVNKPSILFISIDGPRKDNINDVKQIAIIKDLIKNIPWKCNIQKKFNTKNLGCKVAVTEALNWFFNINDYGIILEDDCIPNSDFFQFCEYNLSKYKNNNKVMQISGNNFLMNNDLCKESYYFTTINDIWGWATWKRAWNLFKPDISEYNYSKDYKMFLEYYKNKKIIKWMKIYFDNALKKEHDIWSTQWTYAMIKAGGYTIAPKVNLVKNIGFDRLATTKNNKSFKLYSSIETSSLQIEMDPKIISPNFYLDKIRFKLVKKTDPNLFLFTFVINIIPSSIKNILKYFIKKISFK